MSSKLKWSLSITTYAETDLEFFRKNNKALYLKCFDLLRDILKNPEKGIGKPEKLRYQNANLYSRRVSQEHRLVYIIDFEKSFIQILSFRKHYTF